MTDVRTLTKEKILNCHGNFIWFWGQDFFVETPFGNFHWKDPDYNGDNSFTLVNMNYKEFCKFINTEFGRSKGFHEIEKYCGPNINIIAGDLLVPQ